MNIAISLVALALGYKVFADSHKEKEGIKLLGQVIGIVVMIIAVLSMVCGAAKCVSRSNCSMMFKKGCPSQDKAVCPMHPAGEGSGKSTKE